MSPRTTSFSMQRARPIGSAAVLVACLGCAQVLGVPSDPELVASPAAQGGPAPIRENADLPLPAPLRDPAANADPGAAPEDDRGVRSDGVLPPDIVANLDDTSESRPESPEPGAVPDRADAGAPDAGSDAPPCEGRFERVPVDLVFIFDNSGSMPEEAAS